MLTASLALGDDVLNASRKAFDLVLGYIILLDVVLRNCHSNVFKYVKLKLNTASRQLPASFGGVLTV